MHLKSNHTFVDFVNYVCLDDDLSNELDLLNLNSKEDEKDAHVEQLLSEDAKDDLHNENFVSLIKSQVAFLSHSENPFKSKQGEVAQAFFKAKNFLLLLPTIKDDHDSNL